MADLPEFALSVRTPWTWFILHAGKAVASFSTRAPPLPIWRPRSSTWVCRIGG